VHCCTRVAVCGSGDAPGAGAARAPAGLDVFQHGPHGHIAVRTSGTEVATRLYIEAPAATLERIAFALAEPCPATGRLNTWE
jgi:phosphoglucomutase